MSAYSLFSMALSRYFRTFCLFLSLLFLWSGILPGVKVRELSEEGNATIQ